MHRGRATLHTFSGTFLYVGNWVGNSAINLMMSKMKNSHIGKETPASIKQETTSQNMRETKGGREEEIKMVEGEG